LHLVVDESGHRHMMRALTGLRLRRLALRSTRTSVRVSAAAAAAAAAAADDADDEDDRKDLVARNWLDDDGLARLCESAYLTSLDCDLSDVRDLAPISNMAARLETLKIEIGFRAPDLEPLGTLTRLRTLAIRLSHDLAGHSWRIGATVQSLTRLETLAVLSKYDGFDDSTPTVLSLAVDVPLFPPTLTALDLFALAESAGEMRDSGDAAGWDALLQLPLVSLSIALLLDDDRFTQLLEHCPQLERLTCLGVHAEPRSSPPPPSSLAVSVSALSLSAPIFASPSVQAEEDEETPRSRHCLRHLATEHGSRPSSAARCLADLRHLESFQWANYNDGGDALRLLSQVSAPRLATLVMRTGRSALLEEYSFASLLHWRLSALTDLRLSGDEHGVCASFAEISAFPTLRRLELRDFYTPTDVAMPVPLPRLERLAMFVHSRNYQTHPSPDRLLALYPTLLSLACQSTPSITLPLGRDGASSPSPTTAVMTRARASDAAIIVTGRHPLPR
jgi:hypothetical protein